MPIEVLVPQVKKVLEEKGLKPYGNDQFFSTVVDIVRARFTTLLDFASKGRAYFSDDFEMEPGALDKLNVPGARELLRELGQRLAATSEFSEASVEADLRKLAEERGVKAGVIINASRAALTGQPVGPSVFHVFTAIGRDRVIDRLAKV
jgi:glutamyl-tRNA synthetase